MPYKTLRHTTDLKLKITGEDQINLFTNAAFALFDSIDIRKRRPSNTLGPVRIVRVTALDMEALLVDWLNELLFLHDTYNENYFVVTIQSITQTTIESSVQGIPSTKDRFDVKAATYHELAIEKTDKGLVATVLFDI